MIDYSMYRYFKGEKENPFEKLLNKAEIDKSNLPPPECMKYEYSLSENEVQNLQNSKMFWFYESVFETIFNKETNAYWRNHFNKYAKQKFCRILKGKDDEKPTGSDKATVFDIWLNDYLFVDKLGVEYSGDNSYKKEYYRYGKPL
ncbi:hypothetical protein LJC68_09750 [Bacteroidales bacterium OttesenSCG-928-B11]|nr:hypothetical protein [Bacteroidales bacterium OttesenSCG-928-E04]MDL2313144.1 hypothetical protein [Bacteroidales bacterium OttesenSCG-928-B11]MDL2326817.1 hypothetical protein [Bacteroidales bacterium OttesenSCG-928-A14]